MDGWMDGSINGWSDGQKTAVPKNASEKKE
jgi:hypothetical protein